MIFVILPVHNRIKLTVTCVKSICRQKYKAWHLILIDDNYDDETGNRVKDLVPDSKLSYLKGNGKLWWAGSLQKARTYFFSDINFSDEDIVLILNNDTAFNDNVFSDLVSAISEEPSCLMSGLEKNNRKEPIKCGMKIDWIRFSFVATNGEDELLFLSTRFLFMKASVFNKIGGFHPILLPHYLSDFEYTARAKKKGWGLKVEKRVVFISTTGHSGKISSIDNDFSSIIREYFSKKNNVNPIYLISFVCLVSPMKYKLLNIAQVLLHSSLKLFKLLFLVIWRRLVR